MHFGQIGVDVHLADEKYFPVGHRGVYHTVSNHFYLNKTYVHRPHVLMSVVRHEGCSSCTRLYEQGQSKII